MNEPTIDTSLTPEEVCSLRKAGGWDHDLEEWKSCLASNLLNVTVRNDQNEVIGVGFFTGNARHAELTDLVVHPSYQNRGVARSIVQFINTYACNTGIKYYGLTYDKTFPWLKGFYESEGFKSIDFAMWHKGSLGE